MKRKKPQYVYHGTRADPLDILLHGIQARHDRSGVSVSKSQRRSLWWAGLKGEGAYLLRIPVRVLVAMEPDDLVPADPRYDFVTDPVVNPAHIEIKQDGRWIPLVEAYRELLTDEEIEEWKSRWMAA